MALALQVVARSIRRVARTGPLGEEQASRPPRQSPEEIAGLWMNFFEDPSSEMAAGEGGELAGCWGEGVLAGCWGGGLLAGTDWHAAGCAFATGNSLQK